MPDAIPLSLSNGARLCPARQSIVRSQVFILETLADHPEAGDEIPGTGGVRKLRFAALGRGKCGGARVIHFYVGEHMPIYALLAYAKSAKTDLSPSERRAVRAMVAALKTAGKKTK